ncbi:J domain-containing protein, partial [bacterium]|nr:J domain-containing protein [bacterium]
MHDSPWPEEEEQWVIWNGSYGIVDTVTISRVEVGSGIRNAWLAEPYHMVGPFSLDELETGGQISFAACIVMSRQRWQEEQTALRRESLEKRRQAQKEMFEEFARYNERRSQRRSHFRQFNEKEQRELLNLPLEGALEASQIKAA